MPDLRDLLADAADGPSDPFDPEHVRRRVRQRAQRRRAAGGLAAFAVLGLTVAGLSATSDQRRRDDQVVAGDVDAPTTTAPTTTTSTTAPPASSTVPGTTPTTTAPAPPTTVGPPPTTAAPAELEDGRHFGYLVGSEDAGGRTVLLFDLAQWFEGDEADRAAQEDGAVGEGEEVENDVYIRNTNDRIRRVPVDAAVAVSVVDCDAGCESRPADLPTLLARPRPTPVWLEVVDGLVTVAEEQYLP